MCRAFSVSKIRLISHVILRSIATKNLFCWLADDFSYAVEQKSRSFAGAQDDSEEIDQMSRV